MSATIVCKVTNDQIKTLEVLFQLLDLDFNICIFSEDLVCKDYLVYYLGYNNLTYFLKAAKITESDGKIEVCFNNRIEEYRLVSLDKMMEIMCVTKKS